jgi:hypothetical protein
VYRSPSSTMCSVGNNLLFDNFRLSKSVFTSNLIRRFVEIMATVFSRDAWRCVWHMIQVEYLSLSFI